MQKEDIARIVDEQRAFFASGITRDISYRLGALAALKGSIRQHEAEILEALKQDLGKSSLESYMFEVGVVLSEITYVMKHLRGWASPKRYSGGLSVFPAYNRVYSDPYGCVLIISPWNYPLQLALLPMVDAIAAGNCVVVKPSNYSKHVSQVIETILTECFEPVLAAVVQGGREENTALLEQRFDYIFFTGSPAVGHVVMEKAAQHLTPVTLELGGKSPCIVDSTADIPLAAKRIVWGKLANAGQTCIAPDYVLVQREVKEPLIQALKAEITAQFSENPLSAPYYPAIISERHFRRLLGLIEGEELACGGQYDEAARKIAPVILPNATEQSKAMQEEIFGPILPILTFDDIGEVITRLEQIEHPLALYLFTRDKRTEKRVIRLTRFGGGCINDTLMHAVSHKVPFGGVGQSGMGGYHGRVGFDTFTHKKTMLIRRIGLDHEMRYIHHQQKYEKPVRRILK